MYLPPLGGFDKKTVDTCFEITESFNHNTDISRIENIEEADIGFFNPSQNSTGFRPRGECTLSSAREGASALSLRGSTKNNFRFYEKSKEYIVAQKDMAALSGEGFRHKRNLYNFFVKNYGGYLRDYEEKDDAAVIELYQAWMKERLSKNSEDIYKAMLEDSYKVFCEMLVGRKYLNIVAKVVECGGKIKGFTCGFPVGSAVFCINFEIADLGIKGLAQFIFTEFAKTLGRYPEINIMDDSGIENIRQTKLSYHPIRTVSSFTALLGS